ADQQAADDDDAPACRHDGMRQTEASQMKKQRRPDQPDQERDLPAPFAALEHHEIAQDPADSGLPFSIISKAPDRPISAPPIAAEIGVKEATTTSGVCYFARIIRSSAEGVNRVATRRGTGLRACIASMASRMVSHACCDRQSPERRHSSMRRAA